MATSVPNCANSHECKEKGRLACKNCLLVVYCSAACQKSHWEDHKVYCKSELNKPTWVPTWASEDREPKFEGAFGPNRDFFGDMPALDLLKLDDNEGINYKGPLRLLLTASGDLRNMVKTVVELPREYSGTLEISVNDRDPDIACRNAIILLLAVLVESDEEAIDCMIHIWYSALIRESDIQLLQDRIRPFVEPVCAFFEDKEIGCPIGKTSTVENCTVTVVMRKPTWTHLLYFLEAPVGFTPTLAHKARTLTTKVESRLDDREQFLYHQPPAHRVAHERFMDDGMVLPFGHSREEFCISNPTFFQHSSYWPMKDDASPLAGWCSEEVSATAAGPATADIYGKLFFYLRGMFKSFRDQIRSSKLSIEVVEHDIYPLAPTLEQHSFDRVDVADLTECGVDGMKHILELTVPLLRSPAENPHATLVTLFMGAVADITDNKDHAHELGHNGPALKRLAKYLPGLEESFPSRTDPEFQRVNTAIQAVINSDSVFDRFMRIHEFRKAGDSTGAAIKDKHTIVPKWPFRLKKRPGQPGAQEEFECRMTVQCFGQERYVEWKRV